MDRHGSCLCGAVTYRVKGPMRAVLVCHCSMCRKASGHLWAGSQVALEDIEISGDALRWYRSSETVERGFCSLCGSSLFWRKDGKDKIAVAAGSLESPTGLQIAAHIHTEDKGDYYEIEA